MKGPARACRKIIATRGALLLDELNDRHFIGTAPLHRLVRCMSSHFRSDIIKFIHDRKTLPAL